MFGSVRFVGTLHVVSWGWKTSEVLQGGLLLVGLALLIASDSGSGRNYPTGWILFGAV